MFQSCLYENAINTMPSGNVVFWHVTVQYELGQYLVMAELCVFIPRPEKEFLLLMSI